MHPTHALRSLPLFIAAAVTNGSGIATPSVRDPLPAASITGTPVQHGANPTMTIEPMKLPAVGNARAIAFAHEGRRWAVIARREDDYAVRVFDDARPEKSEPVAITHSRPLELVLGFTPGDAELIAGDARFDWRTGKVSAPEAFSSVTAPIAKTSRMARVWAAEFRLSAGGERAAVLVRDEFLSKRLKGEGPADYRKSSVHLVDARTGIAIADETRRFVDPPFDVSATHLVAMDAGPGAPALAIWKGDAPEALRRPLEGMGTITGLTLDPADRFLVTAHGATLVVWSMPDFSPIARWTLPNGDTVDALACLPGSAGLVVATRSKKLEVWSLETPGQRIAATPIDAGKVPAGARFANALAVSADGTRALVLLNRDLGVRLFALQP